jgi:hypothetical protein
MIRHAVGGPLEGPVSLPERLRIEAMEYFAELYHDVSFYDVEHCELIAITHIPPHSRTWYDKKQLQTIINQTKMGCPHLFEKGKEKELRDFILPLIRPYRIYRVHYPAAIAGEVLMSIKADGTWDAMETPAHVFKYGSPVDFFGLFFKS